MRPPPKLFAALYPFGAGAMGVNLFFASLIGSWMGWPVLTPWQSAAGGLVIGLPATYAFACHIVRLMEKAESR
ncbi:NnrT protein [Heliomarina baculiformis]|uniref:NnrT protein n=1 Tax=Heliomarina baculiformis TaxID=2872036 RepID=UPI000C4BBBDF|nr:NnrT protein [Heliomarina baculiformis]MAY88953.1 NnrT protein [Pseudooceanicola sp.]|tara:strand:- start:587 stop:805 length:219 start_codon:yes stop_codon:yes gene_type:complete